MNNDDSINVTGIPVNLYVDDARVIRDNLPIGTSRDTTTEDCYDSGYFITKRKPSLIGEKCPICKNPLRKEYTGSRGRPGGNVQRRSSVVYALGCGHAFHAGCLLDYLEGDDSFVTLLNEGNNQRVARVPRQTIMSNEVLIGDDTSGIICPEPTCFKRCFTAEVHMLLEYFIGEERERVPQGVIGQYDSIRYTGQDPPPEEVPCIGASCNISGGKRKTKNKVKKKKQVKKQTKKKKQKGKKTKRKNSKK